MRYAELFAGAGGLSLGLERAGMHAAWHAEWSAAPRKILEHHWPDTPLYGDVSTLNGRELVATHGPIDLLSGGSPCQDLSVAGKRAGLTGGARSSLFFQQMRLWDETGADLCLWENVVGALSSNSGEDFALVLSAFVGGAVAVPADGWRGAGVASGRAGIAAWRVLDAQYFGVPQRRRRVFVLGTRTGWFDPAEVLSLPDRVRRHPPTRGEAGEGATGGAVRRVAFAIGFHGVGDGGDARADGSPTVRASDEPAVLAFDINQITNPTHRTDYREGRESPTLSALNRIGAVCTTGDVTHALTHEGRDASEDGTGRGTPIVAGTLEARTNGGGFPGTDGACSGHVVVANTITAREAKGWNPPKDVGNGPVSNGIPRRLTPLECERLMGWPDGWTVAAGSDAARYKACGNGVASPVAEWIGRRIMGAIQAQERAA